MLQLTTKDFKHFTKFIDMLFNTGESIMVTKDGKPFYRLEPVMDRLKPDTYVNGLNLNDIIIDDPFDDD